MPDLYQGTELWDFNLVDPESVGFGEGMNFFLSLSPLFLFTGPNPLQFALKNHARLFVIEHFVNLFGRCLHGRIFKNISNNVKLFMCKGVSYIGSTNVSCDPF